MFRVTGPLCWEFTGDRWISRTKARNAELWCFLWSAPWINDSVGDLRRYRAHYDVIVMSFSALWMVQVDIVLRSHVHDAGSRRLPGKRSHAIAGSKLRNEITCSGIGNTCTWLTGVCTCFDTQTNFHVSYPVQLALSHNYGLNSLQRPGLQ